MLGWSLELCAEMGGGCDLRHLPLPNLRCPGPQRGLEAAVL